MKRIITLSAMMLLFMGSMFAQKLSYQAVVRNSQTNELMVSATMDVTVEILNANNGVQYTETHTGVQSNLNGLITLTIGEGTTNDNLNNVNWNGATIQSTITIQGINPITITTPVNAVPFALQAANAAAGMDQEQADWNETDENAKSYIKHKPTIPEAPDMSNYVTMNKLNDTLNSYIKAETDPTVHNATIFFTQGNEALGQFTTNAEQNVTIDIPATDLSNYVTLNKLNDTLDSYIKAETDPTVPDWAKAETKPTYSYNEITGTPTIPTVNDGTLTIKKGNETYTFSANTDQTVMVDVTAPDLSNYVTLNEMEQAIRDSLANFELKMGQAISDSLANFKAQLMTEVNTMLPTYLAGYMQQNLPNLLPNLLQPYLEDLNIHTASEHTVINPNNIQQPLTLAHAPKAATEVLMYINGVMVGSTANGVISVGEASATSATVPVTYNPNLNYGYNLQEGDKVTFVYVY